MTLPAAQIGPAKQHGFTEGLLRGAGVMERSRSDKGTPARVVGALANIAHNGGADSFGVTAFWDDRGVTILFTREAFAALVADALALLGETT